MQSPTLLAVTPGDPAGIGPEVVWKGIRKNFLKWKATPLLCVGARKPFENLKAKIIEADPKKLIPPNESKPFIWLLPAPEKAPIGFLDGYQVGWSIERATQLVQKNRAAALITGPLHKERLQKGSYFYNGHTDFLAHLCGGVEVTMMLANDQLRVSLVTTHCALKDVSKNLTEPAVFRTIQQTAEALKSHWGIHRPKIAVCGINPHAGEAGLFGKEEIEKITPAVQRAQRTLGTSAIIQGPFPADTLFAKNQMAKKSDQYDAIVCMYHDQGLIPVKLVDFPHTVNLTLGLPIVRTSVDHGTAFDIAGKNLADPRSFIAAVDLALLFLKKNKKRTKK